MSEKCLEAEETLKARDEFIAQWGAISSCWGVNRTMAQIHALLLVSLEPLCTDQLMDQLQISRGNAHGNVKELIQWGLVRSVYIKGDRKEHFEAVKDVWQMFCIITRERKRREIEPALAVLENCARITENSECPAGQEFHRQMEQLSEFVVLISSLMDKLSCAKENKALPIALKLLG